MNDLFAPDSEPHGSEPLDEGGTWLLDLVSAVDHLRLTVSPIREPVDELAELIAAAARPTSRFDPAARR